MNYEATSHKFVVVVNRTHAPATLFNACAHLCVGLGASLQEQAAALPYPAPGLGVTSAISAHPVIILEAKSSTQLLNLLARVRETPELACNMFATSMLGSSSADQLARTAALTAQDADIVAVGLFGERASVEALTKKFSLYKDRSADVLEATP